MNRILSSLACLVYFLLIFSFTFNLVVFLLLRFALFTSLYYKHYINSKFEDNNNKNERLNRRKQNIIKNEQERRNII